MVSSCIRLEARDPARGCFHDHGGRRTNLVGNWPIEPSFGHIGTHHRTIRDVADVEAEVGRIVLRCL